jgi:hypothetical protein
MQKVCQAGKKQAVFFENCRKLRKIPEGKALAGPAGLVFAAPKRMV